MPPTREKSSLSRKTKILLLLALGLVHVAVTWFAVVPGYISIDEAIYHWMVKSYSDSGNLDVWNGYGEFPSPELHHPFLKAHDGKLFPQYPYLFAVLAWPFYSLTGFFGLFLVNSLSFLGVVVLCFLTASKLFDDEDLAITACLVLVLGTFAWDYSQAAWPHMVAVLFAIAAFCLCTYAYCAATRYAAVKFALAAGLVAGFAPGVRLDAFLVIPALILPFLFARPWRPLEAIALVAASVPGLAVLAMTNFVKFGVFSPFSYGLGTVRQAVPAESMLVFGAIALGLVWVSTRSRFIPAVETHRTKVILGVGFLVLGCIFIFPKAMLLLEHMAHYGYVSTVDIRSMDPTIALGAMTRSAGGGVVYIGGQKKALLQSLPFAVILLLPLARIVTGHKDSAALAALFLVPLTVMGYYSYAFIELEGGGLCLSNRYFLVCLPFIAILAAFAIRDLRSRWETGPDWKLMIAAAVVTAGAFLFWTDLSHPTLDDLEFPLLTLPLVIAGLLLVFLIAGEVVGSRASHLCRTVFWFLLISAIVWAGLVSFFYDYPLHRFARASNYRVSEHVLSLVPDNSIFFVHGVYTPSVRLIDKDRVRIALPARDKFKDFPRLLEFHLAAGRPAFALFRDEIWEQLQRGPLHSYKVRLIPLFDGLHAGEIQSTAGPRDKAGTDLPGNETR